MIVSNIKNKNINLKLAKPIEQILSIFESTDFSQLPEGKYNIEENNLFYMVMKYIPKIELEDPFEAHSEYIDVQYIAQGCQQLCSSNLNKNNSILTPYDKDKDVAFYKIPEIYSCINAYAGDFVIFDTCDLHATTALAIKGYERENIIRVVGKVHKNIL